MTGCCYLCGKWGQLEHHHVFGGSSRKKSEYYGLVADLCRDCHNEPPNGVHFNRKNRLALQQEFQAKFEGMHPDVKFVDVFYKNYLDELK